MNKERRLRVNALVLAGLALLLVSGCWDAKEVHRLNYITGLGVDFEDEKFVVYAQMLNFSSIASQQERSSPVKTWVGVGKGSTILGAINDLIATGQGTMFLGHVNYLVLTEKVLKEQMLKKVFDFTNRNKETRYTKWFYGTKGDLFDLFSAKSFFDRSSLDSILGNPEANYSQLSNLKPYYVNDIVSSVLETSSTTIVPSLELTDKVWRESNRPQAMFKKTGGFVFNGTTYVGWLPMSDIVLGRWTQRAYEASPLTLRSGDQIVATLEVKDASHEIEIVDEGNRPPHFKMKLKAKATIMELAAAVSLEEIEKLGEATISDEIMDYYKKGLSLQADLLHLGQTYYRYHPGKWADYSEQGRLPLKPDSLEGVTVHLRINNAQKYKSPQMKGSYKPGE